MIRNVNIGKKIFQIPTFFVGIKKLLDYQSVRMYEYDDLISHIGGIVIQLQNAEAILKRKQKTLMEFFGKKECPEFYAKKILIIDPASEYLHYNTSDLI